MSKDNMFDEAAEQREMEQAQVSAAVTANSDPDEDRSMKMTLSISPKDRVLIKTYAIKRNITVSDLVHQWISKYCNE